MLRWRMMLDESRRGAGVEMKPGGSRVWVGRSRGWGNGRTLAVFLEKTVFVKATALVRVVEIAAPPPDIVALLFQK